MKRSYTQTELYTILTANPLNTLVNIGELEDLQGRDYIFLDVLNDVLVPYDNAGTYQTMIQITIATKEYETRKTLVNYIQQHFTTPATYSTDSEFDYFLAQFTFGVFMQSENISV